MNKRKKIWDNIFKKKNWGEYPAEELIRFNKNFLNHNKKYKKLLELGCGTGGNLWYFAKEGYSITGIDISKNALRKAKIKINSEVKNWKGNLIQADITNYNFKTNKFDVIIDNEFSCCLDFNETMILYQSLYKALNKKGKIFIRAFSNKSYGFSTGKKLSHNTFLPKVGNTKMGLQRFTSKSDIKKLYNNFDLIYLEKINRSINNLKDKIEEWIIVLEKNV